MLLEGKVAVVTGGAGGLGEASCLTFAKEGAKVIVADVVADGAEATTEKVKNNGGQAASYVIDTTDHEKVVSMMQWTVDHYGTIDILLNCPGINEFRELDDVTVEFWKRILDVNLNGTWYCCQAAARHMKKNHRGKIVNTSSGAGVLGIPKAPHYVASKHAIVGLTRALAIDLAPFNINVNCIVPGTFSSPLVERAVNKTFLEEQSKRTPLGRIGTPQEMANAALFLASDLASYVTGVALPVDGGLTSSIRARHWE